MIINYHPSFEKAYKKRIVLNFKLKQNARERIKLFSLESKHPLLKDHGLKGKKRELRAFSVTADIRIVYLPISDNEVLFLDIGTHNQVY